MNLHEEIAQLEEQADQLLAAELRPDTIDVALTTALILQLRALRLALTARSSLD